jgi:toxin ParE1/3/4
MTIRLSLLALQDIQEIRAFTVKQWGQEQWLRYFAALSSALDQINVDPACGRPRDLMRQGMRSLTFQRHLIFFQSPREPNGKTVVLRIIHEKRNFAALSYGDDLEG